MNGILLMRTAGAFLFTLLIGLAAAKCQGAEVTVEEKKLQLATYLLGKEDPNPPFQLIDSDEIYPYTMLDDITDREKMVDYNAIVLENEYLRATILPSLGGRLYSLYDKVNKREVFYRNSSVKYGLIGLRGAWISGGIEFNFPNGHTTDTVSQVSASYRKNADGSATVMVGDVDQVSEMYWMVSLTLRPGVDRLEQHVELFNPTPVENLYWYWNNAAVPATEDMRFIYPMREVNPDAPDEYRTYPMWKGTDYSRYQDIREAAALFGMHVKRTFFGAYYSKADYGVVHYADYHEVPGKKLWTWGTAGDGAIWTGLLTDKDGAYNEIQSGRFETQLGREYMPAQAVESWTEYWYPVQKLKGGIVEATSQFAINVIFQPDTGLKGYIVISVSPTEKISDASIVITLGNKIEKKIDHLSFDPRTTGKFAIPVEDIELARTQTAVDIAENYGDVLLHWSASDPIDGNSSAISLTDAVPTHNQAKEDKSVEELFLHAVQNEKTGKKTGAEENFKAALKLDPNYVPALRKLAIRRYLDGDYAAAESYINKATQLNGSNSEVQYEAGIIERAEGNAALAEDAFWKSIRLDGQSPRAYLQLGEMALQAHNYMRAEDLLQKAMRYGSDNALVQCDLAVALRLRGELSLAANVAAQAVNQAPLYPNALAEGWVIAAKNNNDAGGAQREWADAAGDRMQSYLESGSWYWGLNDFEASDFVLQAAVHRFAADEVSPMVYYYLASNARHEGFQQRALDYAAKARKANYTVVFPQRPSDAAVLREALVVDPDDAHAQYFLGNWLFQHGHYNEAAELWSLATKLGFEYSVLYRNLGVYAWKVKKSLGEAADYYKKAIKLDPQDYRLYVDLDAIDTLENATEAHTQLFSDAPMEVLEHDPALIQYIVLLIEDRQYDKALNLLSNHRFKPWEKGGDVHQVFVAANIEKGRVELLAGNRIEAEKAFRNALEYPANLGRGKPDAPNDAAAHYWLGEALKQNNDTTRADLQWKQVLEGANGSVISKYYESLALERLGRVAEAEAELTALAEAPLHGHTDGMSFYGAGLAERRKGQEQQAKAYFRKALEIRPTLWQAQGELRR